MRAGLSLVILCTLALTAPAQAGEVDRARSLFESGLDENDADKLGAGLEALSGIRGERGMQAGLEALLKRTKGAARSRLMPRIYWQAARGLAAFPKDFALAALGAFIVEEQQRELSEDLLAAVQNNAAPGVIEIHAQVIEGGSFKQKLQSVDQLARLKSLAAGDLLIKVLENERSRMLLARTVNALRSLTGRRSGDAQDWIAWWKAKRDQDPFSSGPEEGGGLRSVTRDGARGGEFHSLERLGDEIIVIESDCCRNRPLRPLDHNYDHLDRLLTGLAIRSKTLSKQAFGALESKDLEGVKAILINCSQLRRHCICPHCRPGGAINYRMGRCTGCSTHISGRDQLSDKAVALIKAFVERGGYLFTEDWGLVEVLEKAWPKLLGAGTYLRDPVRMQAGMRQNQTALPSDMRVDILPEPGMAGHNFMRGVFLQAKEERVGEGPIRTREREPLSTRSRSKHRWAIDDDSPAIVIKKPSIVQVLMRSAELEALTGGQGAVALTFAVGQARPEPPSRRYARRAVREVTTEERHPGGRVMHVLSHFGKQSAASEELALRNLLVNFLLECARRHGLD